MNLHHLGVQLIWVMGQVTLLLAIGIALYLAASRRGPAMRSLFAAGTLAISLGMTAVVLSPWPRWYSVSLAQPAASDDASAAELDDSKDESTLPAANGAQSQQLVASSDSANAPKARQAGDFEDPTRAAISAFWQSLHDNLATPTVQGEAVNRWQWPSVLAMIFVGGVAIGLARILVGLWAVARYRRSAKAVTDPLLVAELGELQASLGCRRAVTVCESATIGTPATIGWRQPLVILPADWREWNATDRRAVVAHELAHVARGDYLSGVVARLTTVLHFYNPLAHWLARRMRFEQELAADASGVACSGGKESYVVALARMALYQDNRALAWAARPFLPSRSTFLRRIEMLRNTSRVEDAPYRPATRRLLLAALAAAALLIAGLRGPMDSSSNLAQAQAPGGAPAAGDTGLQNVPEDTVAYGVIRPAAILAGDTKLREVLATMEKEFDLPKNAGIAPSEVEEFRVMAVDATVPGEGVTIIPVMVLRTIKPGAWQALTDQWKEVEEAQHGGQRYFRAKHEGGVPRGMSYFVKDDRTIVFSRDRGEALRAYIDAPAAGQPPRWADDFKRIASSDAALAVDVRFFSKLIDSQLQRPGGPVGPSKAIPTAFAPVWRQTNTLVASAKIDGTIKAEAIAICKSEAGAEEVRATATAARVLAQNMLPLARAQLGNSQSPEIGEFETAMLDQAEKFLAQVKPERNGKVVTVKVEGTEALGPLLASLVLPAASKAREAAGRARSTNNLKQIALAMLNYADAHGAFPPAVVLGPDGKTPHSWRVAILPYIEQQQLYNQYKFDEPWDSDNNKKLLTKMPAVFRHPSVPGIAGNFESSAYYVLTGKGAMFNDQPAKSGTKLAEITDGTSNTILAVEAKRDIPWTKPEDIAFVADKELPKLGGFSEQGFSLTAADGSVHFVPPAIDPSIFKLLITMADGQAVELHQILAPPGARAVRVGPPGAVLPPPRAVAPPPRK